MNATLPVDAATMLRYNVPGPRYTSYPTALHFHSDISSRTFFEALRTSSRPISIYVHLPFCASLCWYCGCTTVISRRQDLADIYLNYLEQELQHLLPHLQGHRSVVQIHFGGGTPTFLTPEQLQRLGDLLKEHFVWDHNIEFSVEVDPRRLTPSHLETLRAIGSNRISLGVQDIQPDVQEAINRVQPWPLIQDVFQEARRLGFTSINVDLMYGLPRQTLQSFRDTLEKMLSLQPDRWAIFGYAHIPWIKPAQKLLERHGLPGASERIQLFMLAVEYLTTAGYRYIGLDHFARPEDELARAQEAGTLWRNFQGYSTHAGVDLIGLGMSAISQTEGGYFQNHKTLKTYYAALDADYHPLHRGYLLTEDDHIRRYVIMQIMCNLEVSFKDLETRFGIQPLSYFARELEALAPLEADGLLRRQSDGLRITETGRFFLRNVAMIFDRYLKSTKAPRYSQTL